jgi:GTP-binding protein
VSKVTTTALDLKQWDGHNWYWETLVPSREAKIDADKWFTKNARPQFLRSVAYFRQFPESDVPEVAFVGRSNIGKSSLLNAIVNADIKQILARTSKTPGCTKTMNLYGVGPHDGVRVKKGKSGGHDKIVGIGGVLIVDLPGYGEGSLGEWGAEIMKYLTNRKQLRRVFVLVDASHGIKDNDRSLLASLRLSGVPHQVLLSKLDKAYIPETTKEITHFAKPKTASNAFKPHGSIEKLYRTMDKIKTEIKPKHGGGALGELLAVSSEVLIDGKRLGVDAVRIAVLQAAGVKFESKKGKKKVVS